MRLSYGPVAFDRTLAKDILADFIRAPWVYVNVTPVFVLTVITDIIVTRTTRHCSAPRRRRT